MLPSQEEVVRRTEAITRCIQELLISAKDEKVSNIAEEMRAIEQELIFLKFQFDSFIPCSERIVRAVTDMVLLFPEVMVRFFLKLLYALIYIGLISGAWPHRHLCKPVLSDGGGKSF